MPQGFPIVQTVVTLKTSCGSIEKCMAHLVNQKI